LGIYEDITEAERARAELLAAREEFQAAFMTGLDAFCIATLEDGRFIEINDEFTLLVGWGRAEIVGRTSLELGLYDDPTERARIVVELKAKGFVRNREFWGRRKDRSRLRISLSIRTMRIGGRLLTFCAMRDITELWRAQRRSDSLNRLYAMLSGVNEAIARGERPVLDEACRLAVEAGKFRMAWVGMGEPIHHPCRGSRVRGHRCLRGWRKGGPVRRAAL
jgi:PAS domain S-box-containing protein